MLMVIESEKIMEKVNYQVASIGKRRQDIDFRDVVATSGDIYTIDEFVREALVDIVSKTHGAFHGFIPGVELHKYEINVSDGVDADGVEAHVEDYVVSYCVWSILCSFDIPDIKGVNYGKVERKFGELMYYSMTRKIPEEAGRLDETKGSCV